MLALAKDRNPAQTGLRRFQHQKFKQSLIVFDRFAPFFIVVLYIQRISAAPPAAVRRLCLFHYHNSDSGSQKTLSKSTMRSFSTRTPSFSSSCLIKSGLPKACFPLRIPALLTTRCAGIDGLAVCAARIAQPTIREEPAVPSARAMAP